jgi:hypothetical protein
MGLSGFVYCRCWKDAGLDGAIGFDEDGWLELLKPEDPLARWWFQTGCEHEGFTVAWADLGSLSGQRFMRQACEAIGWSLLPTLREVLPTTNDGLIPVDDVPAVLSELDLFESQVSTIEETVLVDEATGDAIYGCIGAHGSVFGMYGALQAGIDPDGFFVRDSAAEPPVEVFRSKRFTQRALDDGMVEFTGGSGPVRLPLFLVGSVLPVTPERLVAVTRPQRPEDWTYRLALLRDLCEAALATGNPVKWG